MHWYLGDGMPEDWLSDVENATEMIRREYEVFDSSFHPHENVRGEGEEREQEQLME